MREERRSITSTNSRSVPCRTRSTYFFIPNSEITSSCLGICCPPIHADAADLIPADGSVIRMGRYAHCQSLSLLEAGHLSPSASPHSHTLHLFQSTKIIIYSRFLIPNSTSLLSAGDLPPPLTHDACIPDISNYPPNLLG